jgi:hypothetical protein
MMRPSKSLIIAGMTLNSLGVWSCMAKKPSASSSNLSVIDKGEGARVQKAMQALFMLFLQDAAQGTEAWALFSYGGWADEGQITVILTDSKKAELALAKPNSNSFGTHVSLPNSSIAALQQKTATFDALPDRTAAVFDAIEYEYVHVVREGQQWTVKARVLMHMVEDKDPASPYADILATFKALGPH